MREPRDPRHPKASEIAASVVPGRIRGGLAAAEKAGAEAAKRRVFLAISDGGIARITTGVITENRRRYLSRCSRRQFPARAARSGQSRCRSPKTSGARSRGVGFFPVLFPVLPPEFESRCFHGFPLMAISPITCLCSGVLIFAGLFGRAINEVSQARVLEFGQNSSSPHIVPRERRLSGFGREEPSVQARFHILFYRLCTSGTKSSPLFLKSP